MIVNITDEKVKQLAGNLELALSRLESDGIYGSEYYDSEAEVPKTHYIEPYTIKGYASSFLSELALEISRQCKQDKLDVRKKIEIKSDDEPGLAERFWGYIDESIDINN